LQYTVIGECMLLVIDCEIHTHKIVTDRKAGFSPNPNSSIFEQ
jgi:hypothetical protein